MAEPSKRVMELARQAAVACRHRPDYSMCYPCVAAMLELEKVSTLARLEAAKAALLKDGQGLTYNQRVAVFGAVNPLS